jgi:transcription elongation factor Elf1
MTSRRLFMSSLMILPAVSLLTSCETDTPAVPNAAASRFKGTGATVLDSNEKKTKIKIKCARCGYKMELEIDTPTADKPYSQEWKCPRCGHKQKVIIEVAKTQ